MKGLVPLYYQMLNTLSVETSLRLKPVSNHGPDFLVGEKTLPSKVPSGATTCGR